MSFFAALRRDLAERAQKYAAPHGLPQLHSLRRTRDPLLWARGRRPATGEFPAGKLQGDSEESGVESTFGESSHPRAAIPAHYEARALEGAQFVHEFGRSAEEHLLPSPGAARWKVAALVGAEPRSHASFGHKARVPLVDGRLDRTEVDLRLGDVLIEAKLTESDFQSARKEVLLSYRDFPEVFDWQQLPVGNILSLLSTPEKRARGACTGMLVLRSHRCPQT